MAGDGVYAIDLARKAVADCLASSRHGPDAIDLLICCNISRCDGPDTRFSFEPSTSLKIKTHFGFKNALAFDISNACAGMLTAVAIADAFIGAGLARCAMVVSGEYITHLTHTAQKEIDSFLDPRLACLTLGDAGAALILERSPDPGGGFHLIDLYTRGEFSTLCIAKASDRPHGGAIMYTDSVRLSAVSIRHSVSHALQCLRNGGWAPTDVDHLVMHQVSKMTLSDAAKEINRVLGAKVCHDGNVVYNVAERGNTATTTHIIALMDLIRRGRIRSGDRMLLGVTGSGLTLGAALYTFDDLPDRLRAGRPRPNGRGPDPAVSGNGPGRATAPLRVRIESVGTVPCDQPTPKETIALATEAARDCLSRSAYSRRDVGLLLYAGVYRNDFLLEPAIAAVLAGELGLGAVPDEEPTNGFHAFDVFNGALGLLNACHVAVQLMRSTKQKVSLIVASEIENNRAAWPERLLGLEETGSALLLSEDDRGGAGFGNFMFRYFDQYADALVVHTGRRAGKHCLHVERDPRLEGYYQECVQDAVAEFLSAEGRSLSDIDLVFLPQVSPRFVGGLRASLSIPEERCVNVAQPGRDLSTSSLPVALRSARERGMVRPGAVGLIVGVGSGIQVGCALYHF
jgi:3-oxoacyl-[acyl-carrier-protein] synthase III